MSDVILLVFEGEKTEVNIFNSIEKEFFTNKEHTVLKATYNTSIYQLWQQLEDDKFLDIVEILRERSNENKSTLDEISREDVSQVYLFFDYEGHDPLADDKKIESMIGHFNEETENGRLYISYPMVEALKDLNNNEKFQKNIIPAKDNINYKKIVGDTSKYQDVSQWNYPDWKYIIIENMCKANYIVNDEYSRPEESPTQDLIFDRQLNKFIIPDGEVAVLSAFPFFIIEYFGQKIIR